MIGAWPSASPCCDYCARTMQAAVERAGNRWRAKGQAPVAFHFTDDTTGTGFRVGYLTDDGTFVAMGVGSSWDAAFRAAEPPPPPREAIVHDWREVEWPERRTPGEEEDWPWP